MAKRHWYTGLRGACKVPRTLLGWWYEIKPRAFLDRYALDPDRYCSDCAKAARLALAKESAPKPQSRNKAGACVVLRHGRCTVCGSHAINPGQSGRDATSDLDLCDVCYWRKRAESAVWPKPRPIREAPKNGTEIQGFEPDIGWRVVAWTFNAWRLCGAEEHTYNPTHFLPMPPEVR